MVLIKIEISLDVFKYEHSNAVCFILSMFLRSFKDFEFCPSESMFLMGGPYSSIFIVLIVKTNSQVLKKCQILNKYFYNK